MSSYAALAAAGVTPRELLLRAVTVTLYMCNLESREQELPHYVRNMGHYILRCLKPAIAKGPKARIYAASVGGLIWGHLKDLLLSIVTYRNEFDRAQRDFEAASREQFRSV